MLHSLSVRLDQPKAESILDPPRRIFFGVTSHVPSRAAGAELPRFQGQPLLDSIEVRALFLLRPTVIAMLLN